MNHENIEVELSLSEIFRILWKRRKIIVLVFAIGIVTVLIYLLFFHKAQFESYATIKIPTSSRSGVSLPSALQGLGGLVGLPDTTSAISDQIALLKSRRVIEAAIVDSGLYQYYLKKIGNKQKQNFTPAHLTNFALKQLKIEILEKNSNILKVSFIHDVPELAYKFVKTLVDNFVQVSAELTKDQNVAMKEYIEAVLPTIENELTQLEISLSKFMRQNNSYNPTEEGKLLLNLYINLEQNLAETSTSLESVKAEVNFTKQKLREMDPKINLPENISSPVIDQLKSQLALAEVELQVLREKFNENAKEVQTQKARVKEIENKLKEEITKMLSARVTTGNLLYDSLLRNLIEATAQLETLQITYNALESRKKALEQRLSQLPEFEQQLVRLKLEYQIKQSTYAMLKQKLAEVNLTLSGYSTFVPIVVDEPIVPFQPSGLGKKIILAIGFVAALFVAILAGFLREMTDKYIRDEFDLKAYKNLHIIDAQKPNELAILIGKDLAAGKKKFILASLDNLNFDFLAEKLMFILGDKLKVVEEFSNVSSENSEPLLIKTSNLLNRSILIENLVDSSVLLVLWRGKSKKKDLEKFIELTSGLCTLSGLILI